MPRRFPTLLLLGALATAGAAQAQPAPSPVEFVGEDDAPTSPLTSVLSSSGTVVAGLAVGMGFLQPYLHSRDPLVFQSPLTLSGLSMGLVLFGLGPNIGDGLNGDLARFFLRGGLRVALGLACVGLAVFGSPLLGILSVFGGLGLASWTVVELIGSVDAPYRWAQRENRARAAAAGLGLRF